MSDDDCVQPPDGEEPQQQHLKRSRLEADRYRAELPPGPPEQNAAAGKSQVTSHTCHLVSNRGHGAVVAHDSQRCTTMGTVIFAELTALMED